MKFLFPILLLPALAAGAAADVPRKRPLNNYASLWTNSPFTSKPPPVEAANAPNPLDDYTLIGLSPITGGYRVTILNRKNPEERVTFDSTNPASKYKIVSVKRDPSKPLGTEVRLSSGSVTGTVRFEPEQLTLKAPPAAPQPQQQGLPPGVNPQPNQPTQPEGQRQPRPRVAPNPGGNANVPRPQNQQRPNRR